MKIIKNHQVSKSNNIISKQAIQGILGQVIDDLKKVIHCKDN